MDKAGVQAALEKAGLSTLIEHIDLLVRDSIRVQTQPARFRTLQTGVSKVGGMPDLPPAAQWPEWQGVPQSFVAQVRLEELQQYNTQKLLPERGMLWFFYAAQQDVYGDDPANKGAWQVLFAENDLDKLQRASAPKSLPKEARFRTSSVTFTSELTLAVQPELEIPDLQWDNDQQAKYDTVFSAFHEGDDGSIPHHRIFGFADVLQDDMRLQAQLYSRGITDWESAEAKALEQGARDWLLLLQIDNDERTGMRWASTGRIYYWVNKDNLQAKDFNQTWFVLQSE